MSGVLDRVSSSQEIVPSPSAKVSTMCAKRVGLRTVDFGLLAAWYLRDEVPSSA